MPLGTETVAMLIGGLLLLCLLLSAKDAIWAARGHPPFEWVQDLLILLAACVAFTPLLVHGAGGVFALPSLLL